MKSTDESQDSTAPNGKENLISKETHDVSFLWNYYEKPKRESHREHFGRVRLDKTIGGMIGWNDDGESVQSLLKILQAGHSFTVFAPQFNAEVRFVAVAKDSKGVGGLPAISGQDLRGDVIAIAKALG